MLTQIKDPTILKDIVKLTFEETVTMHSTTTVSEIIHFPHTFASKGNFFILDNQLENKLYLVLFIDYVKHYFMFTGQFLIYFVCDWPQQYLFLIFLLVVIICSIQGFFIFQMSFLCYMRCKYFPRLVTCLLILFEVFLHTEISV